MLLWSPFVSTNPNLTEPVMKYLRLSLTFVALSTVASAQTWVHPGIVVSPQQLAASRSAYLNNTSSVVVNAVNKAKASSYGSQTYAIQGYYSGGYNQCGQDSNPNNGCSAADSDSNAAYVQALLWYFTGTQAYANNAMNIMNTWASFKGYRGTNGIPCNSGDCSNGPLQAGWDSEKWPRAAEILYYGKTASGAGSGWSSSSFTAFKNMLVNVYQPVIQNGSGVNGNWDMSMIEGTMEIAVLTENSSLLSTARTLWLGRVPDLFYLNSLDGSNHAASPRGTPSWFGQTIFNSSTNNVNQETCRDLTHTEDSISAAIMAAETDWIQGGELYTDTSTSSETGAVVDAEDRIVPALNLIAGFESSGSGQNSVIAAPSSFCTSATNPNTINIGYGATYVIGYNAYHNRLNVAAMADQNGSGGLHGTANTYNWIVNGQNNLSQDNDHGNHMTLFEDMTHSVEVCQSASNAWTNTSFTAQTGSPTVKFNATPSINDINTVIGLSNGAQSAYANLAAIARFNPSGFIDAYNGAVGGYAAVTSVPYIAGTKYSFWFELNIPAQTYSMYVTPEGGAQVQIASNYSFRTSATTLNNYTIHVENGTSGSDNVCSFNLPLGGN